MMHKDNFITALEDKYPHQPVFIQAVKEWSESIFPYLSKNPEFVGLGLLKRMVEPDRVISFKVVWEDDKHELQVNRGYRVQFNNSIGPYKGGLRFDPSVDEGILKFLGFEQIFKNALTGIPMGGAKGGSDFNPKGKTDTEIRRFTQAFMTELYRFIGPYIDVPAGDIGVGGREIGFLFGQYKRITHHHEGVLTGKGTDWGGSFARTEATGYGTVYFAENVLEHAQDKIAGKTALISGSGNVAQYVVKKLLEKDAVPLTMSDRGGFIVVRSGVTAEILEAVQAAKSKGRKLEELSAELGLEYHKGRPWQVKAQLAFPSATQNELEADDAKALIDNGIELVAEGANMPSSLEAIKLFRENKVLFAPGKAANAGGVAVSGLEMSQDAAHTQWTFAEADKRLKDIMKHIHQVCIKYGSKNGKVDYVNGANIGGFVKVAHAMKEQGL